MAGKKDVSRLTVQIGKFAVHDVFDNNSYAQDPRADFLNWSAWAAGAFDYPADRLGLGYGALAEFNQQRCALRFVYFLVGNEPNSDEFDMSLFSHAGDVPEFAGRCSLASRAGTCRVGVRAV